MIAALSYAWGIFSSKDEKKRIEKFIKKFDSKDGISDEHKQMLKSPEVDIPSLSMLGQMATLKNQSASISSHLKR